MKSYDEVYGMVENESNVTHAEYGDGILGIYEHGETKIKELEAELYSLYNIFTCIKNHHLA